MDSIYSYIAGQINPLNPPLVGQTGVILNKEADFVFLPYISFIIAFTALECINDHRKQNKALRFFLSCKCINLHTVCLTFTSSHSAAGFFFSKNIFLLLYYLHLTFGDALFL